MEIPGDGFLSYNGCKDIDNQDCLALPSFFGCIIMLINHTLGSPRGTGSAPFHISSNDFLLPHSCERYWNKIIIILGTAPNLR